MSCGKVAFLLLAWGSSLLRLFLQPELTACLQFKKNIGLCELKLDSGGSPASPDQIFTSHCGLWEVKISQPDFLFPWGTDESSCSHPHFLSLKWALKLCSTATMISPMLCSQSSQSFQTRGCSRQEPVPLQKVKAMKRSGRAESATGGTFASFSSLLGC